jgi:hypothetical protein
MADGYLPGAIMSLLVALLFLVPIARIPRWARLRENQMETIGRQAVGMLDAPARDDG